MLTKRTSLLVSEEDYQLMALLARKKKKTIGALIREAIRKNYREREEFESMQRQNGVKNLMSLWKKQKNQAVLNYKELIAYGRRY